MLLYLIRLYYWTTTTKSKGKILEHGMGTSRCIILSATKVDGDLDDDKVGDSDVCAVSNNVVLSYHPYPIIINLPYSFSDSSQSTVNAPSNNSSLLYSSASF